MALRRPLESSREAWERVLGRPVDAEELLEIRHNVGQFLLLLYDWSLKPTVEAQSMEEEKREIQGTKKKSGGRKGLTKRKKRDRMLPELYASEVSSAEARGSHDSRSIVRGGSQAVARARGRGGHGHAALGRRVDRARARKTET